MSLLKAIKTQLGLSSTPANNFTLTAAADNGTMKLARGNPGATTQDILTVDANGLVTLNQGKQLTLGTAQNTTSGTSIDFTGIPSWVKRITIMFTGVSTNGTSHKLIQLGTSGGIQTTGYNSSSIGISSSGTGSSSSTSGLIVQSDSASAVISGHMTLSISSGTAWISSHSGKFSTTQVCVGGGDVSLVGVLDRIRITTVNGTDTFDAGSVNILYEG